ncbi:MAG TPA: hypothetical protein VKB53_14100 [Gammaproteobacteria bacterium]|nr:hypothetical protein [Gammaproteobacteria bacterium]HKH21975.1 hypothetical protein [Gammaproteobacteria bacterium]
MSKPVDSDFLFCGNCGARVAMRLTNMLTGKLCWFGHDYTSVEIVKQPQPISWVLYLRLCHHCHRFATRRSEAKGGYNSVRPKAQKKAQRQQLIKGWAMNIENAVCKRCGNVAQYVYQGRASVAKLFEMACSACSLKCPCGAVVRVMTEDIFAAVECHLLQHK